VVLAVAGIGAASGPAKASSVVGSGGAAYTPPAGPSSVTTTAATTTGTTTSGVLPASQLETNTGGQAFGQPNPSQTPVVAGNVAQILPNGMAAAPLGAPPAVRAAIWAGNQIVGFPYIYGGGHAAFAASGYDCSGTVSFALHGAGLIKAPMDSREYMSWGASGIGQWITIFTNPGHVYMNIAGIRLDTSKAGDPTGLVGPEWRPLMKPGPAHFRKRYLPGL